jgi:ribonuclease P protein component
LLPRVHRLREPRAFQAVYSRGRSWGDRLVALHVLPAPDDEIRVGISVSKKVGGAVERNRVRRRLREVVRRRLPDLKRGCRLVLVARSEARAARFDDLEAAVERLLARADLIGVGRYRRGAPRPAAASIASG